LKSEKVQKKIIFHQQIPVDDTGQPTLNKSQINALRDYVEFVMPDNCVLVTTPANVSVNGEGYKIIPIQDKKYSNGELRRIIDSQTKNLGMDK